MLEFKDGLASSAFVGERIVGMERLGASARTDATEHGGSVVAAPRIPV
jgi:hypothetical protein